MGEAIESKCPLCQNVAMVDTKDFGRLNRVECETCGRFSIPEKNKLDLWEIHPNEYFKLSGMIRRYSDDANNTDPFELTEEMANDLIEKAEVPHGVIDAMDRLLLHIADEIDRESMDCKVQLRYEIDYPLFFFRNAKEFVYTTSQLKTINWIDVESPIWVDDSVVDSGRGARITYSGWERVRQLREKQVDSNRAFVAMWFNDALNDAYHNGIKIALTDCGYSPVRIDLVQHNEDIPLRILGEIRKSSLVIADLTGQRGGVYYEAGFAFGLGIKVIHTCSRSEVDKLHFDIRNRNAIIWDNPDSLRDKLIDLIRGLGWALK